MEGGSTSNHIGKRLTVAACKVHSFFLDGTRAPCQMHTRKEIVVPVYAHEDILANHLVLVGGNIVQVANVQSSPSKVGLPPSDGMRRNT